MKGYSKYSRVFAISPAFFSDQSLAPVGKTIMMKVSCLTVCTGHCALRTAHSGAKTSPVIKNDETLGCSHNMLFKLSIGKRSLYSARF